MTFIHPIHIFFSLYLLSNKTYYLTPSSSILPVVHPSILIYFSINMHGKKCARRNINLKNLTWIWPKESEKVLREICFHGWQLFLVVTALSGTYYQMPVSTQKTNLNFEKQKHENIQQF